MKQPARLLVVGSFVMDQIVTTSVFPKQGETVLANTFQKAPGGKGANQAVQAARLGADAVMVGRVGTDANGQEMLSVCRKDGVDVSHVSVDPSVSSGCAVIILEENPTLGRQNRILVIPGANMRMTLADVSPLENVLKQADMVMLQLEIPMEVNETVAALAHAHNVPVMLNPAPSAALSDAMLSHLTYISPNEHEAEALTGIAIPRDGNTVDLSCARKAAQALRDRGVENVLITLGDAGAVLLNKSGFLHQPCVPNVVAKDPTAAGDSFVSAFCVSVCSGLSAEAALRFAAYTAALTVSAVGAMPSLPTFDAVTKYMRACGENVPACDR